MNGLSKGTVVWSEIGEEAAGQRIDNYLLKHLKGVPKSHVYRILRSGEVRVNSRRVAATYRLETGDRVRVPPVRTGIRSDRPMPAGPKLGLTPLYEDEWILAIDKPAGLAVHGGSGISAGAIERLRAERPDARFLELVHRLDRETSGVLLMAKKRAALTALHAQLRNGEVDKRYLALVLGKWRNAKQTVELGLHKFVTRGGERRVVVDEEGAASRTVFRLKQQWADFSLLEAHLETGRTHQIRVHLAHLGFPIAGDDKYGDFAANRECASRALKRMFLHAARMTVRHPDSGQRLVLESPLPRELVEFLARLGTVSG